MPRNPARPNTRRLPHLGADGVFAGLPKTESCAACHTEPQGKSAAEATLVSSYVKTEKETPWLVYARQPANVRFSHAIHTKRAKLTCERCHGMHGESDTLRPYQENRISGYSRDIWALDLAVETRRERGYEDGRLRRLPQTAGLRYRLPKLPPLRR